MGTQSFQDTFRSIINAISNHDYDTIHEHSYDVPQHFNWMRDVFEAVHVAARPDTTMLQLVREDGDNVSVTYKEAGGRANRLLNYMRSQGVQQGDTVFVMCGLHEDLWTSYFAIIKGGFVMIPAASILTVDDIAYRFAKAMPKAIITDRENMDKVSEALSRHHSHIPVQLILDDNEDGWQHISVIESQSAVAEAADTRPDDILFWFFTSGTTGMPKVVAHTHASYPLGHLSTAAWIGLKPGDRHYNISQPGWAKFAWSCVFAPLNVGATIFIYKQRDRFNASEQLRIIEQYQVTTLCCPPTALRLLIQEDLTKYNFSLRECVSAGEPLNPEVIEEWKKGTGLLIRDGYGQTESTCMIYNLPGSFVKFGSMGRPSFLYSIVIADEDGNEVPLHEEGQIAVRMDTGKFNGIFKKYIGDEERQKEVFKNNLYYTGDKAYKDEEGYIWFVGRSDDVIKSSDYRVGPFEVESVLLELDEVQESAVVGSPHPIKGYEVKAFIVLNKGVKADAQLAHKIFTYCRANMAPYKTPRILEFVTELPKTISGKIRRVELRAMEAQSKARKEERSNEYHMHKLL